jgi:hypothetical protein
VTLEAVLLSEQSIDGSLSGSHPYWLQIGRSHLYRVTLVDAL